MSDSFNSSNTSSNFFRYCVDMVNPSKVFVYVCYIAASFINLSRNDFVCCQVFYTAEITLP